jgi:hypothetical protein
MRCMELSNQATNKTFIDYVNNLRTKIEKFKSSQQFVYCYMNERLDLAVELFNGSRVKEAWRLYRKISAEIAELLGMYTPKRRIRYYYKRHW